MSYLNCETEGCHRFQGHDGEHSPTADAVPTNLVYTVSKTPPVEKAPPSLEEALGNWWRNKAEAEIEQTVAKAVEYGAYDLEMLGRWMADMVNWEGSRDRATLTELGVAFYLAGKVGRIVGAIREGRLPSDDTWLDIGVYTRMVQRTRDSGGWPQ